MCNTSFDQRATNGHTMDVRGGGENPLQTTTFDVILLFNKKWTNFTCTKNCMCSTCLSNTCEAKKSQTHGGFPSHPLHCIFIWKKLLKHSRDYPNSFNNEQATKYLQTILPTRKAKPASGRLSFKLGYNQRCQWSYFLHTAMPKLHAKFHQNRCTSFGEMWARGNDFV